MAQKKKPAFKKGDLLKSEETIGSVGSVFGIALNSKIATLFYCDGRGGYEISREAIPSYVTVVSNPVEVFTNYEIKLALAAAMTSLLIPNPFKTKK